MILALLLATLFNTVSSTSTPCSGTSYSVPFPYGATGTTPDLVVAAAGVTLTYPSQWTINKVSSTSTGTITLTTACTGTLTITRTTPRTQPLPLRTQGKLDLDALTTSLDRIEMQMQESVAQGGAARLASLTLTTPLPVASGGTGAAPPNCGVGVLTSDGTTFSCVALSGLAPPGTTGILLQSTFPGSPQTGHMSITGSFGSAATPGSGGGYFLPTTSSPGGLSLRPWSYNSGNTGQGAVFNIYGGFNTVPAYQFLWNGGFSNSGYVNLVLNGCGSGGANPSPCISTNSSGPLTPLYLSGTMQNTAANAVYVDTTLNRTIAGTVFGVRNNSLDKFTVDINGAVVAASTVTSTGLTSSGPVSGTTGTFSSTLAVTGVSTHTGSVAMNGGATIGASGTAISGSFRGTLAVGSGSIPLQGCVDQTVTVTGAVVGADCAPGQSSATALGTISQCMITSANTCTFRTCNVTAGVISVPANTLSCRVFNP